MNTLRTSVQALLHLLSPHTCCGCGSDLLAHGQLLCPACHASLPYTQFATHPDNPVERLFRGRLPLAHGMSALYFHRQSIVQSLVHQLKYRHQPALGTYLGRLMGQALLASGWYVHGHATLVPVPLSPGRLRIRGYNQALLLAQGIREVTGWQVEGDTLIRPQYNGSQTKLNMEQRWNNVAEQFRLAQPERVAGRPVLLVDDVLTTGATLEAAGRLLAKVPGVQLSIATLAFALR